MSAQIYVGTYHKYNCGSIKGAWIELEGLDLESFWAKITELHKDEEDPEFMFQDFEGFPEVFYGESGLDERVWEWLELDQNDKDLWQAALDYSSDITFKEAQDRFMGTADSAEDFAQNWLEETGQWDELPELAQRYFNLESYARDLEIDLNFIKHDGKLWVFNY
jgi:antirestriction protein